MPDPTRACCDSCGLAYDIDDDGDPVTQAPYTCDDCGGYVDECLTAPSTARAVDEAVARLRAAPDEVPPVDALHQAAGHVDDTLLSEAVDRVTRHLDARTSMRMLDPDIVEQVGHHVHGNHQLLTTDLRRILAAFDA